MIDFGPHSAVIRTEDPRFLRGAGMYVDDISLPNQLFGYLLRSPHANAQILSIDIGKAKRAPGVVDVLTGEDYLAAGLGALPHNVTKSSDFDPADLFQAIHYPLAAKHVRFVGDGVVFIVAETKIKAQDAAELIAVNYKVLEAVVDPAQAISG